MKSGVLLVNSGTPATLAIRDVRAFLAGLLGDPRVVELPRKQRSWRLRNTPVFRPPLRPIRSSDTGSWGPFNTSDWIARLLTRVVFVWIFTCTRPRRSKSSPGSDVLVCWIR